MLPPPIIFGTALGLGLALGRTRRDGSPRARVVRALGTASVVAGIALGIATLRALRGVRTTVSPYGTPSTLVTRGPFAWTRNPGYVGATAIFVGVAMREESLPALVLLPIALAILDHHVVAAEERRLASLFGDTYATYYRDVPRWF